MENLRSELLNAYDSAKAPGWYAGEGEPVRVETFEDARRFLEALPDRFLPTEIFPEPDGCIAFEWYSTKKRLVVASLDGWGRVIYVVRFSDSDKSSGEVPFQGQIPEVILFFLNRFFSFDGVA